VTVKNIQKEKQMKAIKSLTMALILSGTLAGALTTFSAEKEKPKSYPLDTCVVTDEKLGEHGKSYVFTQDGQEIKMCCKDCLKDFKKDKAKYMKKIEDAQNKEKK
jgi:hypothetical protein